MKRTLYNKLLAWKESKFRKPLILKGARQTGKTFLLLEFGKNEFRAVHHFNFQKDKSACEIFSDDLSPSSILEAMEFYLDSRIDKDNDLVFFDEIQDCPRALTSLKYFYEDMPQLAVACAGSLLGVTHSKEPFPVGMVSFLHLFPMSFEEFLLAIGDERGFKKLRSISKGETLSKSVHKHYMNHLREYFVVGGMPEVVKTYLENSTSKAEAFLKAREKQTELITAYMSDFSKYSGKIRGNEIVAVFESTPAQLARENKKFMAKEVHPSGRFSQLRSPVDWLCGAGLSIKVKIANSGQIPFTAFTKENRFKLYLFDIGILGGLAQLHPKNIFQQSDLFSTFKGAFCENFVAQEFLYSGSGNLYSWMRNTAEIEFLREVNGDVLPVEVKAGYSGKLKSLNVFASKYDVPYRTRISARNLEFSESAKMHNYPLYLAYRFPLK